MGWGLGMGLESELRLGLEFGSAARERRAQQRTRLVLVRPPRLSQYALLLVLTTTRYYSLLLVLTTSNE